ncbi:aldo/keto reductase [Solimonas marina]|uniref:aldo/keto reductase n=1 Tax=Solimonas marina TaxID=2714601 RepID=UPI0019D112E9
MHSADRPESPSFELYDLRVEVVAPPGAKLYCGAQVGDWFELHGEMLHLPPGQAFSIYSLAAILPLLPAKQRETDANDWMTSDAEVACPDPHCPSRFRITRLAKRRFTRSETTAVPLPATLPTVPADDALPPIPRYRLAPDYEISRLIKGSWHLAGDHGEIDRGQALRDMAEFVEAGITTFDCADIYTNVEQMIGDFRAAYPALTHNLRVHTKFVPDLADLDRVDAKLVEFSIDRSIKRLGLERLDAVQFHWWNFERPGYVEAALQLKRLQDKGKIDRISVTNFDIAHLKELLDAGVPVFTHQLQYSLLDNRPESGGMVQFCAEHNIGLLCYGTVAGGFLSERWLNQPEPSGAFANRSLVKYKLIIDDFGGWELFQTLLRVLSGIAAKHGCDIATIATAAILRRDNVAAAIVGATNTKHLPSHRRIGTVHLDANDLALIETVTRHRSGPAGDVYQLERDITGTHGRIMKYDLHK